MFQAPQVMLLWLFALLSVNLSHAASLGFYKARSPVPETSLTRRAPNFDFSNSLWIWNSELVNGNAPVGARPFRKDFVAPTGKTALFADIIITVDNGYTLYVNGAQVGTGGDFHFAERYCVKLESCNNVFALTAVNAGDVPNPAGVLAAIQITYSDGSTDLLVTDASWRTNTAVVPGFEQPSFDDSSWPTAVVEGNYGVAPWGNVAIPTNPATVNFDNTFWIWTDEVDASGAAPVGARAFRRTYTPPSGQTPSTATIIITTDNEYSLYVNGQFVGTGTNWPVAQRFVVNIPPPNNGNSDVVFAVYAVNTGGPAGVLASIEINSDMPGCDCTAGAFVVTDGTWKANLGTPAGFQLPGYDDSAWPAAMVEGPYGVQPWGNVPVPTTNSPPGSPLPGAPP